MDQVALWVARGSLILVINFLVVCMCCARSTSPSTGPSMMERLLTKNWEAMGRTDFWRKTKNSDLHMSKLSCIQMGKFESKVEYMDLEFNGEIRPRDVQLRIICMLMALDDVNKVVFVNKVDQQRLFEPWVFSVVGG